MIGNFLKRRQIEVDEKWADRGGRAWDQEDGRIISRKWACYGARLVGMRQDVNAAPA